MTRQEGTEPGQRTVAELLALHGASQEGGRRRHRRAADGEEEAAAPTSRRERNLPEGGPRAGAQRDQAEVGESSQSPQPPRNGGRAVPNGDQARVSGHFRQPYVETPAPRPHPQISTPLPRPVPTESGHFRRPEAARPEPSRPDSVRPEPTSPAPSSAEVPAEQRARSVAPPTPPTSPLPPRRRLQQPAQPHYPAQPPQSSPPQAPPAQSSPPEQSTGYSNPAPTRSGIAPVSRPEAGVSGQNGGEQSQSSPVMQSGQFIAPSAHPRRAVPARNLAPEPKTDQFPAVQDNLEAPGPSAAAGPNLDGPPTGRIAWDEHRENHLDDTEVGLLPPVPVGGYPNAVQPELVYGGDRDGIEDAELEATGYHNALEEDLDDDEDDYEDDFAEDDEEPLEEFEDPLASAEKSAETEEQSPGKQWAALGVQLAVGVVGGAITWLLFNWLWIKIPAAALICALAIVVGLVWVVRKIRRADDLQTTVLTILVGLIVTVSPAALLLLSK